MKEDGDQWRESREKNTDQLIRSFIINERTMK